MLDSRTSVQASLCSPCILLGVRREGRRSGCSPQGAPFSEMPPSASSSLLSEFDAHPARPSRVSLPGIFSLSKSPCCLEVPARPRTGEEGVALPGAWPGLAGRGGAGSGAWAPAGEAAAAGGTDAAGIAVGAERSPGGCGAAGLQSGGSGACGLHGASGVRLSSGGGSGRGFSSPWETCCPHTWMTRGASTSQVRTAQRRRPGAPRGTPGHASVLAGPGRGSPSAQARGGAGAGQTLTLPPNLFPPSLGGPSRPLGVPSSPFEEPETPFLCWKVLLLEPLRPEPRTYTLDRVAEGSHPGLPSKVPSLPSVPDSATHRQSFQTSPLS